MPQKSVNLHYLDTHAEAPVLLLLHGLTANAHAFDAIAAELQADYRIICPDLRGNGLSDKPASCYSMEDHASDILTLIHHLQLKKVYLGGHSFGGYLSFYLASKYPASVEQLVILDAAKSMHPNAAKMLTGAISRIGVTYNSFDDYIAQIRKAPYLDFWDPAMLSYYRADVEDLPGGKVRPRGNLKAITEKSVGLGKVEWSKLIDEIEQPTLLVNGVGNYALGAPLLPEDMARKTVAEMKRATYVSVAGNHQTMLYGEGARAIAGHLKRFLAEEAAQ